MAGENGVATIEAVPFIFGVVPDPGPTSGILINISAVFMSWLRRIILGSVSLWAFVGLMWSVISAVIGG